jgi:DNA-directed RNA polymerase subunit RPC12/RpoP
VPEPPMRFHPLAPEVKCPDCGASLTFIRVRGGYGDLYQCVRCKHQVIHYVSKEANTCGYAPVTKYGWPGAWTACAAPAAEKS